MRKDSIIINILLLLLIYLSPWYLRIVILLITMYNNNFKEITMNLINFLREHLHIYRYGHLETGFLYIILPDDKIIFIPQQETRYKRFVRVITDDKEEWCIKQPYGTPYIFKPIDIFNNIEKVEIVDEESGVIIKEVNKELMLGNI